ncbi:DUF3572 family protein [Novosphingobium sp.]|uniref:DUF3572 family protein n=1 Tax=Novosphingobium sp. TaxID=1874826 RepID=UPI003BAB2A8D
MLAYSPRKALTIARASASLPDPAATALQALGWVLGDAPRAERFLALTGLTPDELRAGLGDAAVQGAVLEFLCGHEADLIAAAEALGLAPADLAAAREKL